MTFTTNKNKYLDALIYLKHISGCNNKQVFTTNLYFTKYSLRL